ncbi:hypothetical protein HYT02_04310 [Candidatus Gottesmanbacteria bacterium]|nr:hypothetical protein [Candidatus Gottesmanbacteria bacterium]
MNEQDKQHQVHARDIGSLKPEEIDQCLAVPGWRIWTSSIFSSHNQEYWEALQQVRQNPNALVVSPTHRGHDQLDLQIHGVVMPFKLGAFDVPDYILEPLDQETVDQTKQSDTDHKRIVGSEEFRKILDV